MDIIVFLYSMINHGFGDNFLFSINDAKPIKSKL